MFIDLNPKWHCLSVSVCHDRIRSRCFDILSVSTQRLAGICPLASVMPEHVYMQALCPY
uniref:Uncharacterized protein n=1 Tax=Arsenophonus nasoniae TaxID=638 RepID=D2U3U3_9GAMM|nr:hypothetical protein ARN_33340 [Arsenophonus nasoniae]